MQFKFKMTETTNKRKTADDLPAAKKTVKRMCIQSNQNSNHSSCEGQSNEEHIRNIFQKEIDTEIASKIKDLEIIEERLKECHKDLNLLRKAVITSYYEPTYKKSTKFDQHRIHPAVQKLIGKQPISSSVKEEMFERCSRPLTRHMKKDENLSQENLTNQKNVQTAVQNINIEDKVPQYIPPNMSSKGESHLPRGNKQKKQIKFLIGNVSKKVTDGSHDKATHKWMLYVRSLGSFDISKDVSKVRFFLHPSYKPHDVLTIKKAPFTITKRGWGEFPVRVQLHFHNPLNKTVDILHHLKLHGVSSGPHSRSAETIAEVWLYCDDSNINRTSSENSDDLSDSGFLQNSSSSPNYSPKISDTNVLRHNCAKSEYDKTFNSLFAVNESKLLKSECSNINEKINGFNLSLHNDSNFIPTHIFSENNNTSALSVAEDSLQKEQKVNSTINTLDENNKHDDFETSFDKTCQMLLDNLDTSSSNVKCETFNNVFCNSSKLSKDFKMDDLSEVLNIENTVQNNIELFDNENIYFGDIECPLLLSENYCESVQGVATIQEDTTHIKNIMDRQNFCHCDGLADKVEVNSKLKIPDKNVKSSLKEILPESLPVNKILKSDVAESVLKSEKIDSVTGFVNFCINTENILNNNNKCLAYTVTSNTPEISDNSTLLKSKTKCGMNLNTDNDESTVTDDDELSGCVKFKEMELKVKHEPDETSIKVEAACEQIVIKEEIIEIEDYFSNWMEEVVIDVDSNTANNNCPAASDTIQQRNCEEIIIKSEPLSPKPGDVVSLRDQEQNDFKDGFQYLSAPVNNQLEGLTSSIDDFLESTVKCHLDPVSDLNSLSFSSNVTEKLNILENIDEKLLSLTEILPDHEGFLSSEFNKDKKSKKNKLDDSILELPELDSFSDYLSDPVKTLDPESTNIPLAINNKPITKDLTISLDSLHTNIQNKDLEVVEKFTSSAISAVKVGTASSSVALDSNNSCDHKSNMSPTVSANLSQTISKCKSLEVKPQQQASSTTSSVVSVSTLVKINSSGLIETYNMPPESGSKKTSIATVPKLKTNPVESAETQSVLNSSTVKTLPPPIHKGSKHVKKLLKNKHEFFLSSSPLKEKGVHILKQQTVLNASHKLMKKDIDMINCIYIPPGSMNFSVSSNKKTKSILKTVPGVSLLKKNLLGTNGTSVSTNSVPISSLVSGASLLNPVQRVKAQTDSKQQVFLVNGVIEKKPPQCYKEDTQINEGNLKLTSSSQCKQQSQKMPHIPVLVQSLSPTPSTREKKIMVLNKSESRKINFDGRIIHLQNSLERLVTDCKFADMELAVRWLVRGLPLVTSEANQWVYKVIHPYSAPSLAIFQSWPSPKQFASEWLRAKTVCRLLKRVFKEPMWTTKQVLYWARYHGYSPSFSLPAGIENKQSTLNMILHSKQQNIFTPPENIIKWVESCCEKKVEKEECEVIDVEGEAESVKEMKITQEEVEDENEILFCGPEWEKEIGSYVRETVNKLGYRLAREELVPGAALTVLTHSVMVFAEDLLRRSLAASHHRKTSTVELVDTYSALLSKQEFDIFTNAGLGSAQVNNIRSD